MHNGAAGNDARGLAVTVIASHLEVGWELWRRGRRAIAPYLGVMMSDRLAGPWRDGSGLDMVDTPRHPKAFYLGAAATWY